MVLIGRSLTLVPDNVLQRLSYYGISMSLQKMKDMELIPQSESQCFFVRKGDLLFILPPIKLRELYKKNIPKMVYGNKKI